MNGGRHRLAVAAALVAAGVGLGMLLAAGGLAPTSFADAETDPAPEKAVRIAAPVAMPAELGGFADLAQAVSPAVVSIHAARETPDGESVFDLFGDPHRPRGDVPRGDSGGSGFLISSDGLVVTNHHVIAGSSDVEVRLVGRRYPAQVVGEDEATDLALLRIEPEEALTFLELGDSGALRVGSWVMVIGSPLQLDNSVSVGVVSAKGRSINVTADSSLENFIQTDAAINFGNSGGPVVDTGGRVVGIATAINYGADNIGFAVPVDTLRRILPQLRTEGEVRRGYLGVQIEEVTHERAMAFGLDRARGALVVQVRDDGPGLAAGVRHGDIVLQVDGEAVESTRDLIQRVAAKPPGAEVALVLYRAGAEVTATIELGERRLRGAVPAAAQHEEESAVDWLGVEVRDLTPALRGTHRIPAGVGGVWVTGLTAGSPLRDERVRPGDVVAEVDGRPVADAAAFADALSRLAPGAWVRFYVLRFDPRSGEHTSFFAVVRVP